MNFPRTEELERRGGEQTRRVATQLVDKATMLSCWVGGDHAHALACHESWQGLRQLLSPGVTSDYAHAGGHTHVTLAARKMRQKKNEQDEKQEHDKLTTAYPLAP